jgi:hypothetical protein
MALEHLVMVCSEHFTTARDDCRACQDSKAFSNMQDEIAELKAETSRLRKVLESIAASAPDEEVPDVDMSEEEEARLWMKLANKRKNLARKALGKE